MPPRFNRYGEGEEYKTHADGAWMGRSMRTDLACTLFLNDDYEGGELHINGMDIKAGAGVAVVYPCWRPHSVKPVTKGERIAAITWIQSLFRDETERELMQMLQGVLGDIDREQPEGRHYASLSTVYSKLMRIWMEN
jgi:PKHD-type hydroxylase